MPFDVARAIRGGGLDAIRRGKKVNLSARVAHCERARHDSQQPEGYGLAQPKQGCHDGRHDGGGPSCNPSYNVIPSHRHMSVLFQAVTKKLANALFF